MCKCDYCSSDRAESRQFGYSNGTKYFYACQECFEDFIYEEYM